MAPCLSFLIAWSIFVSFFSIVQSHVVRPAFLLQRPIKDPKVYNLPPSSNACRLPAPPRGWLSEGFVPKGSPYGPSAPSTGTLRAKLFFVDFPDAPANDTVQSLYDSMVPGSVDWFTTSSFGRLKLDVDADMSKFYRMPRESAFYTFNRLGAKQETYIQDALGVSRLDYTTKKYDVLYIMPTRAATEITFSPTKISPTRFNGAVIPNIVTYGQDLHLKYGFKILNHETGHVIGLPDLYPADITGLPRGAWAGGFDIMGLINGTHPDYFAWHKWKLGWLDDEQVQCVSNRGTTKHTIAPVEIPGGVKAAVVRLSSTTAFVVEVRSRLAPAVNNPDCPIGLVAYIIDTLADSSFDAPITVFNAHPMSKGCEPDRGGRLTSAAVDFARGEKSLEARQYGVNITIDRVVEGRYDIALTWNGESGPVPGPPGFASGMSDEDTGLEPDDDTSFLAGFLED